jgi:hypothetical protein
MSKKFLTNIDLGASARVIALAPDANSTDPASPKLGQIFFNTNTNSLKFYNGSTWQAIAAGGSTFTLGSTTVSIGGTTTSVSGLTLISPSVSQILNTGSITVPTTTGTLALTSDVSTASGNLVTYANSASLNAYNVGVTYANSASNTAYASAISVAATLATTASNAAYSSASTYANSASLNAYNLGVTYANSASLSAYNTASAWVAGRGYLTSYTETSTLANVTSRGATTSTPIVLSSSSVSANTTTGALTVAGGVGIGGDVYIGGNLNVTGSGYFGGSAMNISASNLSISDPLIYLAQGNTANSSDIGIVGHFTSASIYQHTGLIRSAASGKWVLFSGASAEPTNVVDLTGATYDTLKIGALEVSSSTVVTNLNADFLDGYTSAYFAPINAPTFTGTVNLGSSIATGSVSYSSNSGNSTTTSQTNFATLTLGNVSVARIYSADIANSGASTNIGIAHNLNTSDVLVQVYDKSGLDTVEVDVVRTSANVVTLGFVSAPTTNAYRVVVHG